ncbi:hypothetical protein BDV96DRAFT_655062 [Lophiotrema nucula]|uniref:Uncharacterized protein n=1 Tax=Lophiotrema nucula TaxID=690887 RepID=A0A6A5YIA0_9PLEO|nr:hypothetical protein BDV96DRAFT_655062 [Lophiotrema nucula]
MAMDMNQTKSDKSDAGSECGVSDAGNKGERRGDSNGCVDANSTDHCETFADLTSRTTALRTSKDQSTTAGSQTAPTPASADVTSPTPAQTSTERASTSIDSPTEMTPPVPKAPPNTPVASPTSPTHPTPRIPFRFNLLWHAQERDRHQRRNG